MSAKSDIQSPQWLLMLICCVLCWASCPVRAADWSPNPLLENPGLHRHLYNIGRHYAEVNFDPDANLVGASSPKPPNKQDHVIRESAYYAYGLLLTGDPADRALAQRILKRVVASQITRPDASNRGVFAWSDGVPTRDSNSAAFVGCVLADVIDLDRQRPCLDSEVRQQVEQAARLALQEVVQRDVDPGYTNIALLSTALAAAGQKLWAVPGAGDFAQRKLDAILKLAHDGDFSEYLSPTYTGIDVYAAYLAQRFSFSDKFMTTIDAAIDHLWEEIAASYHAPTYQLAGPYLRTYGNNMLEYAAALKYGLCLALGGNYPIPDTETDHGSEQALLMPLADLPISPRAEFKQPPVLWREFSVVGSGLTPVRHLFQYRDGNFILGTVASQDEWKQKRNLVAFWRNGGPSPDAFRVGFCIEQFTETVPGKFPGEKLHFYCDQKNNAALVAIVADSDTPGRAGCSSLIFANGATVVDGTGVSPIRVRDGTITTYLYPVTRGAASYSTQADAHSFRLMRSWDSADIVGSLHVVAYVLVFGPSNEPVPSVSDLRLYTDKTGATARAKVVGTDLSVSFQR